jgi:metacaspase-1
MRRIGRALCIGVDAEDDARTFASIAKSSGFAEPLLLLGEHATRAAVRAALRELASTSRNGDLVLLAFSGHGGRKVLEGSGVEPEAVPSWQLYDGTLNDRQVRTELGCFREGVRVLVLSDNCSGGVPAMRPSPSFVRGSGPGFGQGFGNGLARLSASVLVLAACQEGQYADGPGLPGHFSRVLRDVWDQGAFAGSYASFHEALCESMPPYQKPDFYRVGTPSPIFESQRPFTI